MEDDSYKLAGAVSESEDQKDEFNRKVLAVLYYGGIRMAEAAQNAP